MNTKRNRPELVNVVTLGCSKNTVDSEFLMRQLEMNNIGIIQNADTFDAKTVIINTCGFIQDAKQESINTILQFVRAKEQGLVRQVFVMGCLSERYKYELQNEIDQVDQYFGVNDLRSIINRLKLDYKEALTGERYLSTPTHYAYLKIAEGCDRKCSFCAIPAFRGKYQSRHMDDLLKEARFLANKGVKELILIAQDLSGYGLDLYKKPALADLLLKLSDIEGIEWIRLHYAHPSGFPKQVADVIRNRPNICNYLDIPVQHASDRVLHYMRRGHSQAQLVELIRYLREKVPGIALRTTVMTGHPGEGEKEYEE